MNRFIFSIVKHLGLILLIKLLNCFAMTTTITKTFHVDHPIEDTWKNLTNPNKVVTCVPGQRSPARWMKIIINGEVELKLGPVKAKYNGLITFLKRDAETKKMVLKGVGTDSKGKAAQK